MALADRIKSGPTLEPIRMMVMGVEGIGKTTFAAGAPGVVFLSAEDGGGDLDIARLTVSSWQEVLSETQALTNEPHDFHTLAIDTADKLEELCWREICRRSKNAPSIEDVGGGFGKGYRFAEEELGRFLEALDVLRRKRRMNIIVLGHTELKKFDDPEGPSYDRYILRMHKAASALWMGWCDAVLFANYDVEIVSGEWNEKKALLGKGKAGDRTAERVIYTEHRPAYDAKNRYSLPPKLPLSWKAFSKAIGWDARDAAQRGGPAKPKHDPSFEGDRASFMVCLDSLGDPYAPHAPKSLYDTICDFLAAGRMPRPSSMKQERRDNLRRILAAEACRKAFIAWEVEGVAPDFRAIAATVPELTSAAAK